MSATESTAPNSNVTSSEEVAPKTAPANTGVWTFLTNHAHVLILLASDPQMRLREVAERVGITERAVQKIVAELEAAGAITRSKVGRRNQYEVHSEQRLRHPVESHCTIGDLIRMVHKDCAALSKPSADEAGDAEDESGE